MVSKFLRNRRKHFMKFSGPRCPPRRKLLVGFRIRHDNPRSKYYLAPIPEEEEPQPVEEPQLVEEPQVVDEDEIQSIAEETQSIAEESSPTEETSTLGRFFSRIVRAITRK